MTDYSSFISPKRRSVPVPEDLVDSYGNCVFGSVDGEFETMDLLHARKPTHAPQFLNRYKLTLWEACEVNLKNGILLVALCDMAFFGKTLCLFFDKRTKKVYSWDHNLSSRKTVIAPNLLNGSIAEAKTRVSHVKYVNHFEKGSCHLCGFHQNETDSISYDFELTRLSKPSIVSIPFGDNRPLYSQKDFFHAEGSLTINGKKVETDEETTAVVDDHRGYYPRHMHYDWVTTMGKNEQNGERKFFAFNLTRNQSIDQDKYNENLIWKEGETSLLPPVVFDHDIPSSQFHGTAVWDVHDAHDMVNVRFHVQGMNPMVMHAGAVNIDYYVAFGELEGTVRDEDGTEYVLDGMMGMGEDKTMLF